MNLCAAPTYPIQVFWSEEDQGYIAVAPDIPGCSAFVDTPEVAVHEMQDAMESWLEACSGMGRELPAPRAKLHMAAG